MRYKPYFWDEVEEGRLGSLLLTELFEKVPPRILWCAAHLHCQYRVGIPTKEGNIVEFQALDKPLYNKRFADVFEVTYFKDDPDCTPQLSQQDLKSCFWIK